MSEPVIFDTDLETIYDGIRSEFETLTGTLVRPGQVQWYLLRAFAARERLMKIACNEAYKQSFVSFATGTMLDNLGALVGCTRLTAQASRTLIRFWRTPGYTGDISIGAGKRIWTADHKAVFVTYAAAVLENGKASVDVTAFCSVVGAWANGYPVSSVIEWELEGVITGVTKVTNAHLSYGGTDAESDDAYRERIPLASQAFSNAGSAAAYRYFAMSAHPDVVDISVVSSAPGSVELYVLVRDGIDPEQAEGIVDDVLLAVFNDRVKPLTDSVTAALPSLVPYALEANLTIARGYDSTTILAAANTIASTIATTIANKLGQNVVPSLFIAGLQGIEGVLKVDLLTPAFIAVSPSEYAKIDGEPIFHVVVES